MNLLQNLTSDQMHARSLSWEHPPLDWKPLLEGGIRVTAPAKADYFRHPAGEMVSDNAPFLWTPVFGDFVARAHVRPTFASTYDSGVLMVRQNPAYWAKLCFEKTDFGTTAAVSVVTRGVSDDANGADLSVESLWLQIARQRDVFAMHYSLDGTKWRMVRVFNLPVIPDLQVGVVTQCPVGPGTTVDLLHFSVEPRKIENLRAGV